MIVLNIENGEDVTIVILEPVDVESVINKKRFFSSVGRASDC